MDQHDFLRGKNMRAKRDRDMEMITQYDLIEDHLQALTGSSVRTKVILSLRDGPKGVSELTREIGASASTLLHSIKALQKDGTVGTGPSYELTHAGHIKALALNNLIKVLAVVSQSEQFWQSHDLSGIPLSLQADIGKLEGATLVQNSPTDPLASQTAFMEAVLRAKEVRGVSGIIAPGYQDMILSLLEKGAKVSLILTRRVIERIKPDAFKAALACDNFTLYEIDDVRVGFSVTNELVTIALYRLDGSYDPQQDLICEGPDAVEWGGELFEYYRGQARIFT
jgi:predicted transcriptional regulator